MELTPSKVTTFRLLETFLTRGLTNVSQLTEDNMTQNKKNYERGMQVVVHRWRKCIANGGDVEK
jgi:hypothetical protein